MNKDKIKEKNEIKYFAKNKLNSEKEKISLNFEINNCEKNNSYSLKCNFHDNNNFNNNNNNIRNSNLVKSLKQNSSFNISQFVCDYNFEKEQKLNIEININDNKKPKTIYIQTSIGEIIGNENKNKKGKKLFNLKGTQEKLVIKSEKIKTSKQFIIFHFTLKISPEINNQMKYEIFKNPNNKIYYIIEKNENKLYESETYTDSGKFNIVQIPEEDLINDFNISFYNDKNQRIGSIKTNIKDFINPEKKGQIFFMKRISISETINIYNFSSKREEITFLDYISKGVRIGLNIGIDFTQSNKSIDDPTSLHCLLKEKRPNPYERAILSCANILAYYDYDQLIPVYGFGAVIKGKYKTSHCFNINFKENPNIQNVNNIIKEYVNCMSKIDFACPTYFSPIINKIINDIKIKKDILDYQLLMILTDGMIQDLEDTIEALVEGSFYPLSVIIIGIGNYDFSKMEQLDGDEIPLISRKGIKRLRDLVQFVPFSKFEGDGKKLANEVLEEIPRQVIQYYTLHFLYPEFINENFEKENTIIDNINKDNFNDTSVSEDKSGIFNDASFILFDQGKKRNISEKEEIIRNYDDVDTMFKSLTLENNSLDIRKTLSQKINRENLPQIVNMQKEKNQLMDKIKK